MAKDFDSNVDISSDTKSDVSSDTGSDFGGDLASDNGVDLNSDNNRDSDVSAAERIAQAAMSNREAPKLGTRIVSGILGNRLGIPPCEASNALAQGVQMIRDGGPIAAQEFMGAVHRQHALEAPPIQGVDFIYDDAGQMVPIKPLDEPLRDQSYYDENGEDITDEKLRE